MLNLEAKYFRGVPPPEVVPEDLEAIEQHGYMTVGVLTTLAYFNSPREYQILMLHHRGRKKNLEGQLGPLAETMRVVSAEEKFLKVEQPMSAVGRGMREELGGFPKDPLIYCGYFLSEWPVYESIAFAICPVFLTSDHSWVPEFPQTAEITETRFLNPLDVLRRPDSWLRKGTKRFVEEVQVFFEPSLRRAGKISFADSAPTRRGSWEDIHLGLTSVGS